MNIKFFCPRWGSAGLSWDEFLSKVKDTGYDGVEYGIAASTPASEVEMVCRKAEQIGLLLIAQHHDTSDLDINLHADNFDAWFRKIEPFNWIKVNSQTGKHFFLFEQNIRLIDVATA